ncbi:unnamed protein product [Amaranthus hypochondriacus]
MDPKDKIKEVDNCLDSQLWHACAGGMVQMPLVNSRVYYFVQGHTEHANGNVDFRNFPRIPSYVLCRVEDIRYLADHETDEVYAKIRLIPVGNEIDYNDEDIGVHSGEVQENKPASFAKTLTQSDANNGGGFSVPRYCAETIFPRLDYSADPPVQNILAKDVHGEPWKFRHIYRGTPRRHLLTTGWSTFVNAKKLIAGDSIVFLRTENGDLCVGIRRAKRGIGGGLDSTSGWNPGSNVLNYGAFSGFLREDENRITRNGNGIGLNSGNALAKVKIKVESVIESATHAAKGQPFEVVYYPRAGTPEFVVKAGHVKAALQIRWCSGMRFKMPFETEDSSRISWFMGTISSVQVADPVHWPDSPWRLLQVTWDEPDLLQNVKRVSPWLVELVSNMPAIHLSPFSPPRKKFRLPHHPDFPIDGQLPVPPFPGNFLGSSNPFGCLPDNFPAGMQGARHAQFGLSLSDFHMSKLQSGLFPAGFPALDPTTTPSNRPSSSLSFQKPASNDSVSCLLTMGNPNQSVKKSNATKPHHFVLFGKPILTERQMSLSRSGDAVSPVPTGNSSSEGNVDKAGNVSDGSGSALNHDRSSVEQHPWLKDNRPEIDMELETGHCKVFMESEDVGRTVELTLLNSYEELCCKLASMFDIETSDMLNRVVYRDGSGSSKQIGDEPFSEFARSAKRLTILMDSSSDNVGA